MFLLYFNCIFFHPKPWILIKSVLFSIRTPILSSLCISLLWIEKKTTRKVCHSFCFVVFFHLLLLFIKPDQDTLLPLNCNILRNKGRFIMPSLTFPYRKWGMDSCHLPRQPSKESNSSALLHWFREVNDSLCACKQKCPPVKPSHWSYMVFKSRAIIYFFAHKLYVFTLAQSGHFKWKISCCFPI